MARTPRIGLALGSGSARGWSHIGVLRALEEQGIRPDLVCGTSIGALVGAIHAEGRLDEFEPWICGLGWKGVASLMDPGWRGGLLAGDKLFSVLSRDYLKRDIGQLPLPFAAVATDLESGREVWLRDGPVADAVRASIAMPGLFRPALRDGACLVDGGVVNPVPVSLARAMGADIVIAVDLDFDIAGRHLRQTGEDVPPGGADGWLDRWWPVRSSGTGDPEKRLPSMIDVVTGAIGVMQVRIGRSRLAGDPADAVITPRLGHLGLLEFHRAAEAIAEGRSAVQRALPMIERALQGR